MMEAIQEYLGSIVLGFSGTFLTLLWRGYGSLMRRIKTLEEKQIKMQGEIDLNTALDNERAN